MKVFKSLLTALVFVALSVPAYAEDCTDQNDAIEARVVPSPEKKAEPKHTASENRKKEKDEVEKTTVSEDSVVIPDQN